MLLRIFFPLCLSIVYLFSGTAFTKTLDIRISEDLGSLNWNHGEITYPVILQTMEGLTKVNSKGTAKPAIANWKYSADYKEIRFFLNPKAKWNNGDPVCAEDFVRSWEKSLSPEVASPYAFLLKDIQKTTAKNCQILVVEFKKPQKLFHFITSHWVSFPLHKNPTVTNGPYVLKTWEKDRYFILTPNTEYKLSAVPKNQLKFHVIQDDTTALRLFQSKKLHWVRDVAFQERPALSKKPEYKINPAFISYFLGFNMKEGGISQKIRCTLLKNLDREEIPKILNGGEIPAYAVVHPLFLPHKKFSKSSDAQLTAEELFSLKNLELHYYTKNIHQPLVQWIQNQWKKHLNLDVKLSPHDSKSYWSMLEKTPPELFLSGTTSIYSHPYGFLSEFHSDNAANWGKYKSADYDSYTEGFQTTKANQLIVEKDCAIIPLYFRNSITLNKASCNDVAVNPMGWPDFRNYDCR